MSARGKKHSVEENRAKYLLSEAETEQTEGHIVAIKTTGEVRRFTSTEAANNWLDEEGVVNW